MYKYSVNYFIDYFPDIQSYQAFNIDLVICMKYFAIWVVYTLISMFTNKFSSNIMDLLPIVLDKDKKVSKEKIVIEVIMQLKTFIIMDKTSYYYKY